MRIATWCCVFVSMFLTPFARAQDRAARPTPPNIVLIVADDLGYADLGVYGSTFYETPNLDRLAAQGLRFTDAYASAPVCSPTRASLLTGKYPARVGVTDYIPGGSRGKLLPAPFTMQLPPDERNLAESLKDAGYATWHVGKWHLGKEPYYPQHQGFDVNVAGGSTGHPRKGFFSPYNIPNLTDGPEGEYLTDRITDEAIQLIDGRTKDKPFFLNMWHYAPHIPIQAPEKLVHKYKEKAKQLGLDGKDVMEPGEHYPIEKKRNARVTRRRVQSDPVYAAMIENLDANVGRLLDAIEKNGQSDNTIVVFTSDNGGVSTSEGSPTCNAPLRDGKGFLYEGGIRVPLIVKWPGGAVAGGSTCDAPVTSADVMPSLLAIAGQPLQGDAKVDGINVVEMLRNTDAPARPLFWHYPHYGNQGGTPSSAIRLGQWKLIEFFEDGRLELYDLQNDVGETRDLSKKQPERVKELHAKLKAWREQVGARIPAPNPDFAPPAAP